MFEFMLIDARGQATVLALIPPPLESEESDEVTC